MKDVKAAWDVPTNLGIQQASEAGVLALKYRISADRAQMLIDRLGHDPEAPEAAAKKISADNPQGR